MCIICAYDYNQRGRVGTVRRAYVIQLCQSKQRATHTNILRHQVFPSLEPHRRKAKQYLRPLSIPTGGLLFLTGCSSHPCFTVVIYFFFLACIAASVCTVLPKAVGWRTVSFQSRGSGSMSAWESASLSEWSPSAWC